MIFFINDEFKSYIFDRTQREIKINASFVPRFLLRDQWQDNLSN